MIPTAEGRRARRLEARPPRSEPRPSRQRCAGPVGPQRGPAGHGTAAWQQEAAARNQCRSRASTRPRQESVAPARGAGRACRPRCRRDPARGSPDDLQAEGLGQDPRARSPATRRGSRARRHRRSWRAACRRSRSRLRGQPVSPPPVDEAGSAVHDRVEANRRRRPRCGGIRFTPFIRAVERRGTAVVVVLGGACFRIGRLPRKTLATRAARASILRPGTDE